MAILIPIAPSLPFQEFALSIDGVQYIFDVRWNQRSNLGAGAWYFSVLEEDRTPVISGIKIVLGVMLGRRANHTLFRDGIIVATDLSGEGREATLDDIGERVQVARFELGEVLSMRVVATYPDRAEIAAAQAAAEEE